MLMIDDTVRLYSVASRLPVDAVAPQHAEIHDDLERWAAWNRERYTPARATSAEGNYRRTRAQDQSTEYPQLPIAKPTNPRNLQIDRALLRMPEQHRAALRLFYVTRSQPSYICRVLNLHWSGFGRWMFDSRSMVLNILRFQAS